MRPLYPMPHPVPPFAEQAQAPPFDEAAFAIQAISLHHQALAEAREAEPAAEPIAGLGGTARSLEILLIKGPFDRLTTSQPADVVLSIRPTQANGWRSVVSLATDPDHKVEYFAPPRGAASFPPTVDRTAMRALALHRLGHADRTTCAKSTEQPMVLRKAIARHPGTKDALSAADLIACMKSAESAVAFKGPYPPKQALRRVHLFENVTSGDALGLSSMVFRDAPPISTSLSMRSWARRVSDGAVVAFSETIFR